MICTAVLLHRLPLDGSSHHHPAGNPIIAARTFMLQNPAEFFSCLPSNISTGEIVYKTE